jgi:hypothetical protein
LTISKKKVRLTKFFITKFYCIKKYLSRLLLTILLFTLISFTLVKAKSPAYCCNVWDPRTVFPPYFSYFCIDPFSQKEIEVVITYNCCYAAWKSNGWNAPVGLNCPSSDCPIEHSK